VERENKEPSPDQRQAQAQAVQHVAEAHSLLTTLREKLDKHPELEDAIEKLEMALSTLTVRTGALL
jgi:ribulose 1,5-bisphosphate carboxylase large subunit-like protein